jgi:hypothetical protein
MLSVMRTVPSWDATNCGSIRRLADHLHRCSGKAVVVIDEVQKVIPHTLDGASFACFDDVNRLMLMLPVFVAEASSADGSGELIRAIHILQAWS